MYEYLNDIEFLTKLDKMQLRTQYAKIILLTFDEKPIKEITGNITSGSLSVNSSSSIRRTINFSMLASPEFSDIEDLTNDIALNKKIRVEVGLKNPFKEYDDIIWFPCGLYVISSANVQRSTSGWSISVSGKDKMCLLDGTAGGTLPASTTFHEVYVEQDDGTIEIEYPTIYRIIFEAVNHWGGEAAENIVISDLDEKVKQLVKYMGDEPIYFDSDYTSFSPVQTDNFFIMKSYNQDVGYKETDFTYPGELVLAAGETVVSLLDKIVQVLGNFEYFYDVNGKFIFQEIKNYLNTPSPINEYNSELLSLNVDHYVQSYDNGKYLYSLTDLDTTTTIIKSPKYDNIKNDFYAWGIRTSSSGAEIGIRYHLAIDAKPEIFLANKWMWKIEDENHFIIRFDFTDTNVCNTEGAILFSSPSLIENNWREELYRRAVVAQVSNSVYDNYYDNELLAEWRQLYNPDEPKWIATQGWNPQVYNEPSALNYWLDIIDEGAEIGKYSVPQIGRRTKVANENTLKSIYNTEVPDIIFMDNVDSEKIKEFNSYGQQYFVLTSAYQDLFKASSTGASCFDKIRDMLYQNLSYNTTIQITCLPKYYIEANNIIHIEDKESHINGNYQITQFTLPLAYNGTMSITATEVLTRV